MSRELVWIARVMVAGLVLAAWLAGWTYALGLLREASNAAVVAGVILVLVQMGVAAAALVRLWQAAGGRQG